MILKSTIPYILLVSIATACSFSPAKTRKLLQASSDKSYDVIIVPGVPFIDGKWSRIMKARVYWSKYLYERGIAKNIMYSGSAVYSPYYEAEIMALYAKKLGIPAERIFVETRAEHSTENVYYSYRKAKNLGFDKIALATDPFQAKMISGFISKKVSEEISLIPIVFDTLRAMESEMTDPEINYLLAAKEDFVSIKERESFRTRFSGTRGKRIDTTAYQQAP